MKDVLHTFAEWLEIGITDQPEYHDRITRYQNALAYQHNYRELKTKNKERT